MLVSTEKVSRYLDTVENSTAKKKLLVISTTEIYILTWRLID